jgi:hypothetical protein
LRAVFPGNNPKAIVLDLVQPLAAGRQLVGDWEARRDEPGGSGRSVIPAARLLANAAIAKHVEIIVTPLTG